MSKLVLEKAEEPEIKLPSIRWIIKKAREFQKNIYFCFIDYAKAFDCVDHNKRENSERDGNTRPPDLPLEKPICRSGSNSENWTWNNRLVPNRKRSMSRLCIVTLQTLGWKTHKLESRLMEGISITSYMQMTPPLWQKVKRN